MRLSNYRGRESAARPLFSFFFLSAFPFFFLFSFFRSSQDVARDRRAARIRDYSGLIGGEVAAGAEEPLIYGSDYFICINASRAFSIISIGDIIFHASDNFVRALRGISASAIVVIASDRC
jgi:hypothetical protein